MGPTEGAGHGLAEQGTRIDTGGFGMIDFAKIVAMLVFWIVVGLGMWWVITRVGLTPEVRE